MQTTKHASKTGTGHTLIEVQKVVLCTKAKMDVRTWVFKSFKSIFIDWIILIITTYDAMQSVVIQLSVNWWEWTHESWGWSLLITEPTYSCNKSNHLGFSEIWLTGLCLQSEISGMWCGVVCTLPKVFCKYKIMSVIRDFWNVMWCCLYTSKSVL